jgi:hypothetical protein
LDDGGARCVDVQRLFGLAAVGALLALVLAAGFTGLALVLAALVAGGGRAGESSEWQGSKGEGGECRFE